MTLLKLLLLVVAWYFVLNFQPRRPPTNLTLEQFAAAAGRIALPPPSTEAFDVLIGINAATDVILPAARVLEGLPLGGFDGKETNHAVLRSLADLREAFAYFFRRGSAAERFFSDEQGFDAVVDVAKRVPGASFRTGGNAALMAEYFTEIGDHIKVELVAAVGPELRRILAAQLLQNLPEQSKVHKDEFHIIMEYLRDEEHNGVISPRDNRFIFSHDRTNSELLFLEQLHELMKAKEKHPHLLVISGVHMLEGVDQQTRTWRLKALASVLRDVPKSTALHLEIASIADLEFIGLIFTEILPLVDSLGCNEQELAAFVAAKQGAHADLIDDHLDESRVDIINDMIHWLLTSHRNTRLSRVHFHSLLFHVIASHADSHLWHDEAVAVAAGSFVASTRACQVDALSHHLFDLPFPQSFSLSALHSDLTIPRAFSFDSPVISWVNDNLEYALSPVFRCLELKRTVGLGDAISARGLYAHLHSH